MKNFPSIKKAKKILNWHPKIKLNDGLKNTIKSFNEKQTLNKRYNELL